MELLAGSRVLLTVDGICLRGRDTALIVRRTEPVAENEAGIEPTARISIIVTRSAGRTRKELKGIILHVWREFVVYIGPEPLRRNVTKIQTEIVQRIFADGCAVVIEEREIRRFAAVDVVDQINELLCFFRSGSIESRSLASPAICCRSAKH